MPKSRSYRVYDAHSEHTTLRVDVRDDGWVQFWLGEAKGGDEPRLGSMGPEQARDLAEWLLRTLKP
jgi:hypothetical protein